MLLNILFCFLTFLFLEINSLNLPKRTYQDIYLNGKIIKKGYGQNCEKRYEFIKKVLDQYKRPITVLDLGAAEGYFSFRIATEYPNATVVALQSPDYNKNLIFKLCQLHDLDNLILLNKNIDHKELQTLANCEHFDVVIAMNVIHHFKRHWKKAADAILNLGDNIFIETPPNCQAVGRRFLKSIRDYLGSRKNGKLLALLPRWNSWNFKSYLLFFSEQKTELINNFWFLKKKDERWQNKDYQIISDFNEKYFVKKNKIEDLKLEWNRGINLVTFKMLNGVYPLKDNILNELLRLGKMEHNDCVPQNIIIQGKKLIFIDLGLPRSGENKKKSCEKNMNYIVDFINFENFETIKEFFQQKIMNANWEYQSNFQPNDELLDYVVE